MKHKQEQETGAGLAAARGSAESELWHEYLRSEGLTQYEGLCRCWSCEAIRDGFEKWQAERDQRTRQNSVLADKKSVLPDNEKQV